jgi:hypothetical protein
MDQLLETNGSEQRSLFQSITRTVQGASRMYADSIALLMRSLLLALLWAWLWDMATSYIMYSGLGNWASLLFLAWYFLKCFMLLNAHPIYQLIAQIDLAASALLVLYYGTRMRSLRQALAVLSPEALVIPLEYFLPEASLDGYPLTAVFEQLASPETSALMERSFRRQFCFNDTFIQGISPMMNTNADAPAQMHPTAEACIDYWTPVPEHRTWNAVRNQTLAEDHMIQMFLKALVQSTLGLVAVGIPIWRRWGPN